MTDLAMLERIGAGTIGIWGLLGLAFITLIKTWPIIQQRVIEARAQQADEDQSLRTDLLSRIGELEEELREERKRCSEELQRLRGELIGVTRQFVQFQLAVAQAIPPTSMTPEMIKALGDLARVTSGEADPVG